MMKIKIVLLVIVIIFSFNIAFADTAEGIVTTYDCGDGFCTTGESCSNCPIDCGRCETSSPTSSTIKITVTTSALGSTIEVENLSVFVPTQPPFEVETEEGLPEITGEAVASPPSEQVIPLNMSVLVLAGLIFVFLLLRRRASANKKYKKTPRRSYVRKR